VELTPLLELPALVRPASELDGIVVVACALRRRGEVWVPRHRLQSLDGRRSFAVWLIYAASDCQHGVGRVDSYTD
jgi:hypothetical protein